VALCVCVCARVSVSVHDNVNCVVSSVGVEGVLCGVPSGKVC
jgi:hypothetical protein